MTETPTTKNDLLRSTRLPERDIQCPCGDWFRSSAPNATYHTPECRQLYGKAKSGQKSGDGRRAQTEKELKRATSLAAMEAAGIEISDAVKRLPPELQYTAQRGLPHAAPLTEDDLRVERFLAAFATNGDVSQSAQIADGRPGTGRAFRNLFEKSKLLNSEFSKRWQEALDAWGAVVNQAVIEEAVVGREVFAASMGNVVSLGRMRDTKLLAQLKRQTDKEFAKANSAAGSNVTVNVSAGANANPEDPDNPSFTFWLRETYRLSDADRAHLSRIAKLILGARTGGDVVIDLTPDPTTQALLEEIRRDENDGDDTDDT